MLKIGILTSGGDCQGLNAAIHGVAKALYRELGRNVKLYGIQDGYRGLIEGECRKMEEEEFSGILTLGGTILGTSRQPFKLMRVADENSVDKVQRMKANYRKWGLNSLVILGGNGTHKTANLLSKEGLAIVTLPKTIDNDLWGTDMTFGFQSAVEIAAYVLDCIHTTATSHSRVFIVEIMGHKAGWLTLHAGIAGGADVILIPEIPYEIGQVAKMIQKREKAGKRFSILAVAEGAISKQEAQLSKKERKALRTAQADPAVSYRIARELGERVGQEIRVTVPGHFQRGGSPCAYDRVLAARLGAAAAGLISKGQFGNMVGIVNGEIQPIPLSEVAGKLKLVPTDCGLVRSAQDMGICLGE